MNNKESKTLLYSLICYIQSDTNCCLATLIIVISSNFALTFTCIKTKPCSFCCLRERHRGKQHQKTRNVDSLSRKTWRWFEKKRSMFLLLQTWHLDKKDVWFLQKFLIFVCCYVNRVMLYSFVKIISKFKNEHLLQRKLHQKWVRMPFLKLLKCRSIIIYLLIALAFWSMNNSSDE